MRFAAKRSSSVLEILVSDKPEISYFIYPTEGNPDMYFLLLELDSGEVMRVLIVRL